MSNIPLHYSLNRVGLPLIITSSKPTLCFLIDTGASHNVLFSFVYAELQHLFSALEPKDKTILMGIDGSPNKVSQVKGTIAFEGKQSEVKFSVMDATKAIYKVQKESGIQIHGILGIPFLVENKWILDFDKLNIRTEQR
jgi:hypothetical protein